LKSGVSSILNRVFLGFTRGAVLDHTLFSFLMGKGVLASHEVQISFTMKKKTSRPCHAPHLMPRK